MTLIEHPVLTPTEDRFMRRLLDARGVYVPFEQLSLAVWGYSDRGTYQNLRVIARRVRAKLGEECIVSIRGVGYRAAGFPVLERIES